MKYFLLPLFCLLVFGFHAEAQQSVDNSFQFQGTNKKYSIYVPSGYQASTPAKMMLGMHPFNTNRWDAEAWRDTLTVFAENNQLLLVCPDGGPDGNILDQLDTAFTTALLDSVYQWYNIDMDNRYIMGFSRGGQATYAYGLDNAEVFGGYIVIGAAASASDLTNPRKTAADGEAFAIIHGSGDAPGFRFTPLRDGLVSNNAVVWDTLMSGVGHTIDFANRNSILSRGFVFVDSVNNHVAPIPNSIDESDRGGSLKYWPNPVLNELHLELTDDNEGLVAVLDAQGRLVFEEEASGSLTISTQRWPSGTYWLQVAGKSYQILKTN